jgi:hypothetical protein
MQLIHNGSCQLADKHLADKHLAEKVAIVACTNRREDRAGV